MDVSHLRQWPNSWVYPGGTPPVVKERPGRELPLPPSTPARATVDQHAPGAKLDHGKDTFAMSLGYFPNALAAIDKVSRFGAAKYSPGGWRHVPEGRSRYTEALIRHLLTELSGEAIDPESDLYHDIHTAWNALARLELRLKEERNND